MSISKQASRTKKARSALTIAPPPKKKTSQNGKLQTLQEQIKMLLKTSQGTEGEGKDRPNVAVHFG